MGGFQPVLPGACLWSSRRFEVVWWQEALVPQGVVRERAASKALKSIRNLKIIFNT